MIDPRDPDYTDTPASQRRPLLAYQPADASAKPFVTVVTPFYNNARELFHETARCVLAQSLQQWEWIVVNDAATDPQALAVLETYRDADPRIRIIDHGKNKGLAAARNTGFANARSDFVFLLDDDDLIETTALEKHAWFLTSYDEFAFVNGWTVGFGEQEYLWQDGFEREEAFLTENRVTALAMIRKGVHAQVGGYDESIRHGFEDWDFWLRCANAGLWGATMPEFLVWYRRRADHGRRWDSLADQKKREAFIEQLKRRYPKLYEENGFPKIRARWDLALDPIRPALPCKNVLTKGKKRALMIVPWLRLGGADKFNIDLLEQLRKRDWEVTVATTLEGDNSWAPEFTRLTSDVFVMPNFLRRTDYPVFLNYLITSRRPDVVLMTNSELAYLILPYLRANCPGPTYVDYCHMEEEYWKNGGYPRYAAAHQEELDLNIVSSQHLKDWMVARGARPNRIEVCYTNRDPELWSACPKQRKCIRAEKKIGPDEVVILYAGRLCAQKKPRVFAHVMKNLADRGVAYRALVAGCGEDEQWLEAFVVEHALGHRVHLLGAVPNEAMRGLMSASDLLFLPSLWEGIALTLFEAMSMGLAIVATNVGGQRELVTPECGILIEPSTDEEEIEAHTEVLAELLPDREKIREMGRNGRERICTHFQLDQMGDRMVELFERAGQLRGRSSRSTVSPRLALEYARLGVELARMSSLLDFHWVSSQRKREDPEVAARLRALEEERNVAWAEAQRLARCWDENIAYIRKLEREREHRLYIRARRLAGRILRRLGLRR